MKYLLPLFIALHFATAAHAQSGCTDPQATNYNASATNNDGSCVYPPTSANGVYKTDIPTVSETSGMLWSDSKLWTHDDSGGPATIFQIDTSTGQVTKSVIIDNFGNIDWEDIAADNNFIYIAETGNNNGNRTDLKILKIAKADIGAGATVHVNATAINFSYADQTSFTPSTTHNFDCEAITVVGDSIYLFSKNRGDQHTKLYLLPKIPGTYAVMPHTSYNVGCLITGADYSTTKKEITLLGYSSGLPPASVLWILNDYKTDSVFSGNKRKISLPYSSVWQTEGIAYLTDSDYFISTEEVSQLSLPAKLFKLKKTWQPVTSISEIAEHNISIFPNPANEYIVIKGEVKGLIYRIIDLSGKILSNEKITSDEHIIKTNNLATGVYYIEVYNANYIILSEKFIKQR